LNKIGISSVYYHGGLSTVEKANQFNLWMSYSNRVMVATNAFGMGIDKSNVQTVIHHNLPDSLESYYQEAGRAGRNGDNAYAVILTNNTDEVKTKKEQVGSIPSIDFLKKVYKRICNYFQISYGEGVDSIHNFNFKSFCSFYNFPTVLTYSALKILDRSSIISLEKKFKNSISIKVIVNSNALFNYLDKYPKQALIIKVILRGNEGVFDNSTEISLLEIINKTKLSEKKVIHLLTKLNDANIIQFEHSKTDAKVTFIEPREDDKTINRISKIIKQQEVLKIKQIESVFDYIKNDGICKSQKLLSYFEEINSSLCGICSSCLMGKLTKKNKDFV
jgi:ATP-dependent DNA helicase RecQ